jgi:hypothetical protein
MKMTAAMTMCIMSSSPLLFGLLQECPDGREQSFSLLWGCLLATMFDIAYRHGVDVGHSGQFVYLDLVNCSQG